MPERMGEIMGTWKADPFGNDTACDWQRGLDNVHDLRLIKDAIRKIHGAGMEYLEAPDAEEAIAAADTIARLKGRFYVKNAYTKSVDDWVAKHNLDLPQEFVDSAIEAVDRILTPPSELLELWEESDEFESWKRHLEDLKTRLR